VLGATVRVEVIAIEARQHADPARPRAREPRRQCLARDLDRSVPRPARVTGAHRFEEASVIELELEPFVADERSHARHAHHRRSERRQRRRDERRGAGLAVRARDPHRHELAGPARRIDPRVHRASSRYRKARHGPSECRPSR
jgi:hypothetical protein